MAREFNAPFYKSTKWKKCRASFIKERQGIDGGMCMRCRKAPGYIVHHKIYLTPENIDNPDISLSHSNLEYLCLNCHNKEHEGREEVEGMVHVTFNAKGETIPVNP